MRGRTERIASVGIGAIAGIALVMSCNKIEHTAAQEDMGGACCSTSGPITIAGKPKVVTAETDLAQFQTGHASGLPATSPGSGPNPGPVVSGPFIITDIGTNGTGTIDISYGSCSGAAIAAWSFPLTGIHGARIPVPAGYVACVLMDNGGGISWSGFTPYSG
jgi:hypothetical protein